MPNPMYQNLLEAQQFDRDSNSRKPPGQITQEELAEYQNLKKKEKELKRQLSARRDQLLQKLERNAEIESGHLSCELKLYPLRTFSYDKIVSLIGKESANNLRNRLEPTIQKRVVVRESG